MVSLDEYRKQFPSAPLLSDLARETLAEHHRAKGIAPVAEAHAESVDGAIAYHLHEVFGLGAVPAALNARKEPIPITVLPASEHQALVPTKTDDHVWDIDLLKNILMALELNLPLLLWGHKGTGKTSGLLQVCARTNRPRIRVQHTLNTEEAHITGMWTVTRIQPLSAS